MLNVHFPETWTWFHHWIIDCKIPENVPDKVISGSVPAWIMLFIVLSTSLLSISDIFVEAAILSSVALLSFLLMWRSSGPQVREKATWRWAYQLNTSIWNATTCIFHEIMTHWLVNCGGQITPYGVQNRLSYKSTSMYMHISAEGLNASCNASFTQLSDTDTEITKSTFHLHQSFGNAAVFNLVSDSQLPWSSWVIWLWVYCLVLSVSNNKCHYRYNCYHWQE